MWEGQIDGLSDEYRVIAPDLRGFGRSDVVDTASMEEFAGDLVALLDTLIINQPVALCGLSMGGYIAWQFWRRFGNRLDRLILCDTRAAADTDEAAAARRQNADEVLARGADALADSMIPKLFASQTLQNRTELVAATRKVMTGTERQGIAAALRGMADRSDMTPQLADIQVPALVICGQDDAISTPAEMRSIAAVIPRARYVEIANAGHMAPLEQPGPVNDAIRAFLRETA
jgi:pimeloyl-ACP methyl ester carboxylesterase